MNLPAIKKSIEKNLLFELNQEGFISKVNGEVYQLLGYQPQELAGKKYKDLLIIGEQNLHDIESEISSKDDIVVSFDSAIRHKQGYPIFMQWNIYWSNLQKSMVCIGKPLNMEEFVHAKEKQELQMLNAINECIQFNHEPEELFDCICKIMVKTGKYPLAFIGKINPNYLEIWFRESENYIPDVIFNQTELVKHIFEEIKDKENQLTVLRFSETEIKQLLPNIDLMAKNIALMPIDLGGDTKWLFGVIASDPNAFDEKEILVLERLSKNLIFALRSVQNEKSSLASEIDLRKYIRELNLLNEVNTIIQQSKDEEELVKQTLQSIVQHGGYKLAWLTYFEKDHEKKSIILPKYFAGENEYAHTLSLNLNDPEVLKGPSANCILTQKTSIINSTQEDTNYGLWSEKTKKYGLKSSISIYLNIEGNEKAAISIYSGIKNAFDYREKLILERLINNLSNGISNIRNNKIKLEKEVELAVSKSTLLNYQTVLDDIAIISVTDTEGNVISVNKNFEEFFGYSLVDVIDKKFYLLKSAQHDQNFWDNIQQTIHSGKIWNGEILNKTKNGDLKWLETTVYPFTDKNNNPIQFMSVSWDISFRKQLEEKDRYIGKIVETAIDPIYSVDLNGIMTSWNEAAEKVFGYKKEEVIGRQINSFLSNENINEEKQIVEIVKKGIAISQFESQRLAKGGIPIYLIMTVSPITDDKNKIIGYSKISKDITRAKKAEIESLKIKSDLEFRNNEINIINDLTSIYINKNNDLQTILTKTIPLIEQAWSSKNNINAVIKYKNNEYLNQEMPFSSNFIIGKYEDNVNNNLIVTLFQNEDQKFNLEDQKILDRISSFLNFIINAKEIEKKLNERLKEINTLVTILDKFSVDSNSITEIIEQFLNFIPQGWQFPEITIAKVTYGNDTYISNNELEMVEKMEVEFRTIDHKKGVIEIGYTCHCDKEFEGPFLKEERRLINTLAIKLTNIINRYILQKRIKHSNNLLRTVINSSSSTFILLNENMDIIYANDFAIKTGKLKYGYNLNPGNNLKDQKEGETRNKFLTLIENLKDQNELSFTIDNVDKNNAPQVFDIKLSRITNEHTGESEILFVSHNISHLTQHKEDVNKLIAILKNLKQITSEEISHEFHKLQAIVELAQDLELVDDDLKEIFNSSKETFEKANLAIYKLIDCINAPLKAEINNEYNLNETEKIFLIEDDDISAKISSRVLTKFFDKSQIICFKDMDTAINYFQVNEDNGHHIFLLDKQFNEKTNWKFLSHYETNNLKSPIILIGSNPYHEIKQKYWDYQCIKNYIQKPLNKEIAKSLVSKEILQ